MSGGTYFVYMLATRRDGPIYVGVTNNLVRRVQEHKSHAVRSFTQHYNVDRLVYWEVFDEPALAIDREKQLKKWRRAWKIALIQKDNPDWLDRFGELCGDRQNGNE
ncbi:MAG: GIY-YIG nuclease [Methylobacterium sp.]|nr:MAG: GIY-YIG nuclease [Methylobacterium sp.]